MATIIDLRSWFGGRSEPWRKVANSGAVDVVDEDTGEIISIRPRRDEPTDIEGLMIRFRYSDAGGSQSRREILCHQCWREGGVTYVRGQCILRNALRTFRIDRMSDVYESRSRRKVGDLDAYFRPYIKGPDLADDGFPGDASGIPEVEIKFTKPSLAEIEADAFRRHTQHRARKDCIAGLRVLAYIALSDDVRSEEERNVEISFLESRLAVCGHEYNPDMTEALVQVAAALAVPPGSLTRAVNAVAEDEGYFLLVLSSARLLAAIDGDTNSIETDAIDRLIAAGRKRGYVIPPPD